MFTSKHKRPHSSPSSSKRTMPDVSQCPILNYVTVHSNKNTMILVQNKTSRPM